MGRNNTGTEDRIMDSAVAHFSRKGFDGARIDEIAKEAGVNKAAIYYHIGDKGVLYGRVVEQVLGGIATRVADNIKGAETDSERIHAFVTTLANNLSENTHVAPLLLREIAAGGGGLPDSAMLQMVRIFSALFCILDEAGEQGRFRKVNPLIMHLLILGGLAAHVAGRGMRERIGSLGGDEFKIDSQIDAGEAGLQIADIIVNSIEI